MESTYKNIYFLFLFVLVLIFIGFYKTYFSLFPSFEGVKSIYHFHAFMFLSWVAFLIIQPILIRKKKIEWHRFLGKISYVLIPMLILSVCLVVQNEQVRSKNLMNLSFAFSDMGFFLLMYGLAIFNKNRTSYHIRYMVMTILPFINPSVARVIYGFPTAMIGLTIILSLIIFERFRTKIYHPLIVGLLSFLIFYGVFSMLPLSFWDIIWQFIFS